MKIGTFTLGGGYAMLPLVQREVVDNRHAVNSAIFIGWRIGGWKGVCGAVLGAVLPSFCIILAIAMVFSEWKQLPAVEAAFRGIRPAVVALIAAPLVKMAKSAKISWLTAIIPIVAALLIWLGHLNPVWVILATIVLTLIAVYVAERRAK